MVAAGDAEALEFLDDLSAQVVRLVEGRAAEVAALRGDGVAAAGVDGRVGGDGDAEVVGVAAEVDAVEDVELELGAEERAVGDAGLAEPGLGLAGDAARVAGVGFARVGCDGVAEKAERRALEEGVEEGRARVGDGGEVAGFEGAEAGDAGAVVADAVVDEGGVELARGDGEVKPFTGEADDFQVDEGDFFSADPGEGVFGVVEHGGHSAAAVTCGRCG